jgi:hypothetical protein
VTLGRGPTVSFVFVVVLVLHAVLLPAQGLTDDDDFYATAGIRYAAWLQDVVTSPSHAFTRDAIDSAFKANHEHPPLAKFVFGVSSAIMHDGLGLFGSLDGARLGCALFAALLAAVLVLLAWEPLGAGVALAAPLLLLSLPRFFFHSEVATLDVPVASAVVVVTALFFWSERASRHRERLAVLAGVAFGLSLLVKLNAPFAMVPCAAWAMLSRWRGLRVDGGSLVLPPVPPALPWMIVLGPLLFIALWPWLWFDTIERLGAYIAFHMNHYPIYLFYDGEIWEKPFAPPAAVAVLGFGAMPFTVVVLGLLGALRSARAVVRIARAAVTDGSAPDASSGDQLRALVLLQAAFSMALVANPVTPRYGGEKLFMPFFPFFCLLAADGAMLVVDAARTFAPKIGPAPAAVVVVALAAAPGVVGTAKHHGGYALSYYGETVGGLRGAVARGYERTYYDVADKALARWLDDHARGSRVHVEPNHKEYVRTYRWMKKDGVIRGVNLVDDKRSADVIVLTHERRWATYPSLKSDIEQWGTPVLEKSIDGVPLYTVYRRR